MNKKIKKIITESVLSLDTQNQNWAKDLKIEVTQTKDLNHGDFTCNVAMRLSKMVNMPPLEIAKKIIAPVEAIEGVK